MFGFLRRDNKPKTGIIINAESLETRVAMLEDGKLEEFYVEHPTEERIVGCIYKGLVQNLDDGLQAAFVDIGMRKNAFIHYWDMIPEDSMRLEEAEGEGRRDSKNRRRVSNQEIARRFPIGSEIVVQVTKGPIGTKGPRVTADLSIPGRYIVLMPGSELRGVSRKIADKKERLRLKKTLARIPIPNDVGIIARTAGAGARKTSFVRDVRALSAIWADIKQTRADTPAPCCLYQEPSLVERMVRDFLTEDVRHVVVDDKDVYECIRKVASQISRRAAKSIRLYEGDIPVFEHYDVDRQLKDAFRRKVNLESGGHIVFDETEALIAIDVNTGKHKASNSEQNVIAEVNIEAVGEVARQLRLRNVGGLVVIDLIDMRSRRDQNRVYRALKDALKRDRARTNVLPISPLGLLEMTRQRAEESVHASMFVNCPYCRGHGVIKSALSMSIEVQRRIVQVMRRCQKQPGGVQLRVVVHPNVLERFKREDEQIFVGLESKYHGQLSFVADPRLHVEAFAIQNAANGEELYTSTQGEN